MDYSLLFAYWHYSICNLTIQYANLIESGDVLAFLVFSCYTITRYKTRKNQGLTRVSPISGVGHISTYMPPQHSSDVHASMPA